MFTWGKLCAEATPRLVARLYNLYATEVQYEPHRTDMYWTQMVIENVVLILVCISVML